MIIQFDAAHNVKANEEFKAPLIDILTDKLNRLSQHIARLEVHLADENGNKEGMNDKRCLLEAHVEGMPHIVVKNHANTYEQAVDGAAEKLIGSLNSMLGKLEDGHKR
jgi:ribosome-associated translation inhibitor RaiA